MKQQRLWTLLCSFFLLSASPTTAQPQPPISANRPVLRLGSQGSDVTNVQAALKLLGYYTGPVDGTYAENTVIAVFLFQQAANLNATGIVDAATWTTLFPTAIQPPQPPAPPPTNIPPTADSRPTLRLGMSGPAVRTLQERLNALGFSVGVDGVFGDRTLQAVMAAQQRFNLNPDGVVGPTTWQVLLGR